MMRGVSAMADVTTKTVQFGDEIDANVAYGIAEGVCDSVALNGTKLTLEGTRVDIDSALHEMELSGVPATPV
jgi:hypothetical protein